jgi:DNA-binding beta-propeller fold protein YncE
MALLRQLPPLVDNATIIQRVTRAGVVSDDPSLAAWQVTAVQHVQLPGIDHQVASPFWIFMTANGLVLAGEQYRTEALFENPFYATGYPLTEAYWATVKIAGTARNVLVQCFERRCLTYTPGNPDGWQVEAGNVGQHYYHWRYVQVPAEATMPDYVYAGQWGGAPDPVVRPVGAYAVSVDNEDNFWITDYTRDNFMKFDEHGRYLASIGVEGTSAGEFDMPTDMGVSADGSLYFLDSGNNRVQVFSAAGVYQFQWGAFGAGPGQFSDPRCLAIRDATVYVCDHLNHRVQMFDLAGNYQGQFGGLGSGDGQFDWPQGLTTDADGNIYVADFNNHRVQIFDSTGGYLAQFGSAGAGPGQFAGPWGVAIDAAGFIYVADSENHRIQKFNADGSYQEEWGPLGSAAGQFYFPYDLSLDSDDNLYVADTGNERVQVFTSAGAFLFLVSDDRRGRFLQPLDIARDHNGNVLVVDGSTKLAGVARFTPDGVPLDDLRTFPKGTALTGVAVNAAGDIYVTDRATHTVRRFSAAWQELGQWGSLGSGPGQFNNPNDVAVDTDSNVYIVDSGNNRVQKFDAAGGFIGQWGSIGGGEGQFSDPQGIAIAGERVYVTDADNNRVQVFDRDGNYLDQWGGSGSGIGQLRYPAGIAVNTSGQVLVVEMLNYRVQVFTDTGIAVGTFGSAGSGDGQFNSPRGVMVDATGAVYVTDSANARVQKFTPVQ